MSYHGGVIGGILSILIYSKVKKWDYREIGDMYAASIPLGFTFGRLGNFINGELYGRITAGPFGIIFPHGGIHPSDKHFAAIRDGAEQLGLTAIAGPGGVLNYPRHPSQLYEMIFEGIVLWAIIWFFRNRKPFKGFLITLYLSGYGLFRFVIEYFREPDADLGYRIDFARTNIPPALGHPLLSFSTGQILCFWMIVLGLVWAFIASRMKDPVPVRVYADKNTQHIKTQKSAEEKTAERNRRRKLRNKLR
jgi:phosphatidylglycerol:prolipoprotein diacylglycerol transferase